jgi:pantoate--beta-alanine ligase
LNGQRIALVPTMGALHEGHLSLIRLAKSRADRVVASLFVNPAQFAPDEDFSAYPRDEARDSALLARAGCDLLYAPELPVMYPPGFATMVNVGGLTACLEGEVRPGHFAGVATIVAKLLIQAAPDLAVFGEKDFQQLQVIRRLTRDLDLPVEIVGAPITRDADGLALSSRNAYLNPEERRIAAALSRVLSDVARAIAGGEMIAAAEAAGGAALLSAGFARVDYLETRHPETLERLGPGRLTVPARILCAAHLGRTRLLDNVTIVPMH